MEPIIEQLKDFCDCLPELKDDAFQKNVEEMIHLISNLTCWAQHPCETFLNSERSETIDVEEFNRCVCGGGIIEFDPYYIPVHPGSFKVFLVEQDGINEHMVELDASDYEYGQTFGKLRIDVSGYIKNDSCGCPSKYKLLVKYYAGYEMIPECLLQLFCDLLHVIMDKNTCDCSACQACKSDEDVVVEFSEGDEVSPNLQAYLNALVESGYKKQIGLMSLCGRGASCGIWGTVV